MIALREENVNRWFDMAFGTYKGVLPLAIQTHAADKVETNILPISNKWMVGKPISRNMMVQQMINLAQKDGTLKDTYNRELTDKDPEGKEKFVIHLYRIIQHPDYPNTKGVLYYDLIINITPPFLFGERISKKLTPEEWIKKLETVRPFLAGLKDITPSELIYRPFILAQGFTGGFKPSYMYKGSRYEGRGSGPVHTYNASEYFKIPPITAKDFEDLISYQNQSKDTAGTVFRAWDRCLVNNQLIFKDIP